MRWPNRWWWATLTVAGVMGAISDTWWFTVGIAFGMLAAYIDADSSSRKRL